MEIALPLIALAIAFGGGLGLVLLLRRIESSNLNGFAIGGIGLIFGAGLVSFSTFCLGLVIHGLLLRGLVTVICLAMLGLGWRRYGFAWPRLPALRWSDPKAFAIALAGLQTAFVTWFSLYRENLDWDGLFNWEFKARVAFLSGGRLPLTFFASSYGFLHREYPPLVPLLDAWIYGFLGYMDQSMVKLVGPYFYLAVALLALSVAMRTNGWRWAPVLVVLPVLLVPAFATGVGSAASGYADFPLSAVYLCAVVHALDCWRTQSMESARFVGISGFFLAFTKLDSLMLLAYLAVALAPLVRAPNGRQLLAWALVPGFTLAVAWSAFTKAYGLRQYDMESFTLHTFLSHIDRARPILGWTWEEISLLTNWSILWALVAAALVYLAVRTSIRDWYPWAAVAVLPVIAYPCVFFFSAWNPVEPHVKSSITRLFIHIAGSATEAKAHD